jgi:CheY-like chemotaxis protein
MMPKVVVVDDEPAIVDVVCDVLYDADVQGVPCISGHEANSCILDTRPQAVILDIQMPVVDGIEIFKRMRADPLTRDIPVIFFTANADKLKQRLPNYREMGAQLLPKPFQIDKLLDLVNRAISN